MSLNKTWKLFEKLGVVIIGIFMIIIVALFAGTILWIIYPHIHALFPTAAQKGIIATDLAWWDSVCVVWIFQILFRQSNYSKTSA